MKAFRFLVYLVPSSNGTALEIRTAAEGLLRETFLRAISNAVSEMAPVGFARRVVDAAATGLCALEREVFSSREFALAAINVAAKAGKIGVFPVRLCGGEMVTFFNDFRPLMGEDFLAGVAVLERAVTQIVEENRGHYWETPVEFL